MTDHDVVYGTASRINVTSGNRARCHAIARPDETWPGNRLCHMPILADALTGVWRHETAAELAQRGVQS